MLPLSTFIFVFDKSMIVYFTTRQSAFENQYRDLFPLNSLLA